MAWMNNGYRFGRSLKIMLCSFSLWVFSFQPVMAQTWSEWFRQKRTQRKYLAEQIVALRMYADVAKKGYNLARSGLNTISDLSKGEFSLHNAFISGLKQVNPSIRNSAKVAQILEMQLSISNGFRRLGNSAELSVSDHQYIDRVRQLIWEECLDDLEELLIVITAGKLEMEDGERIARIDKIYLSMGEKSAFAQHFHQTILTHINHKQDEKRSLKNIWELYGLKDQ